MLIQRTAAPLAGNLQSGAVLGCMNLKLSRRTRCVEGRSTWNVYATNPQLREARRVVLTVAILSVPPASCQCLDVACPANIVLLPGTIEPHYGQT